MARFSRLLSPGLAGADAVAAALVASGPPAWAQTPDTRPAEASTTRPNAEEGARRIEVCFVLDTTGSMSNLIQGAKRKIWHIANGIVRKRPSARVRFGLIGYRDRGDHYVTTRLDLTQNIDAVHQKLKRFKADGGGDRPESVNRALHEAVTKMSWPEDPAVTKILFLVGDALPHMDYTDDLDYPAVCKKAVKRNLIINTVQCGDNPRTRKAWRAIARRAEGKYAAIGQGGGMRIEETLYDKKLAALNREIGDTMVPYGAKKARAARKKRQAASERP